MIVVELPGSKPLPPPEYFISSARSLLCPPPLASLPQFVIELPGSQFSKGVAAKKRLFEILQPRLAEQRDALMMEGRIGAGQAKARWVETAVFLFPQNHGVLRKNRRRCLRPLMIGQKVNFAIQLAVPLS